MTQPTTRNPASAQPMRTLSKRAQAQLQLRRYGQQVPTITPSARGTIPNALRTNKPRATP